MGKKAELLIKEDLLSLKKSLSHAKKMRIKRRIQSLIFSKEEKFETRQHLADYLCIHIRTLEKWLVRYKSKGFSELISIARSGSRSKEMHASLHQDLKEKLGDNKNYFCSYKEALSWLNETYQTDFKYDWFRKYLIKHFGTKLKVPRKSHIEKDEKAVNIFFKKLPLVFREIKQKVENKWQNINLYFQDESRFGLKTDIGRCLTSKGIKPIVSYQHKFANTYLYGTYSPINGDSFVWEVEGVSNVIFEKYLKDFSNHKRDEFKIVIIDNAGFHTTKNIKIPENIFLLRIPPYSPELNPCEQIWEYIKPKYKNKIFKTMKELKEYLYEVVRNMEEETIKSIVSNHHYLDAFYAVF